MHEPDPILTLTVNPTVDVLVEVDELVASGKVRADVQHVAPGGGGINVARGVALLGGAATAIHTSGGPTGQRLDRLLDEARIDHLSVAIDGETREATMLVERATERTFHIVPSGPTLEAGTADRLMEAVVDRLGPQHIVVASGSLPPGCPEDLYARLARAVRTAGARLVLDTSGPALTAALEEEVHLLRTNRKEASGVLGGELTGFADACRLNEKLLDRRAAHVVATTLGELGAVVSSGDGHVPVRAPRLPRPFLSDAGAGDSFVAALTLGLARGFDLAEAGRLAVTTAAAACMTAGTELFDRRDVEELCRETHVDEAA